MSLTFAASSLLERIEALRTSGSDTKLIQRKTTDNIESVILEAYSEKGEKRTIRVEINTTHDKVDIVLKGENLRIQRNQFELNANLARVHFEKGTATSVSVMTLDQEDSAHRLLTATTILDQTSVVIHSVPFDESEAVSSLNAPEEWCDLEVAIVNTVMRYLELGAS